MKSENAKGPQAVIVTPSVPADLEFDLQAIALLESEVRSIAPRGVLLESILSTILQLVRSARYLLSLQALEVSSSAVAEPEPEPAAQMSWMTEQAYFVTDGGAVDE